ncbi:hypothetical protein [Leeuwenhoekiella marinoflava]|uniref:PH (Pleckstrin Homology) domain-containing protein n=2 Tax=Leeuwenhoekiella marinoflava TaxID=988 RepID=A0A4Q0PR61_9FLAO|nr:hypothetical protein [Leeuwenhoekiella marinoflava]RXG33034.1 hypothetical protein DSL99_127 [Leeuwenhoekiella marinoflava]SHE36179.1 hypothetical protein SAMN02745246_00186 [Leeuwenhoekiella marinoflava DSM 3653]
MSKKITFINQNKPWRLVVPAIGLILFFTAILGFKENILGKILQPMGMLLTFIPLIFPFKMRDFLKYTQKIISFKLDKGGTYSYRFSQIQYVEAYEDHLVIYKSKKKFEKVNTASYAKADVNRLIDLLKPETKIAPEAS